ncbi:MAG: response regulator [Fibromonadaceae bacterium]|jgi:response regulator RpfG family c-di-GMP phosphodiesterase|nr:response regulator [Fibromonadaceae bacterium]
MDKKKNSVLIVDDENLNIMALTHILSAEYTIYAAKDGQAAINAAEKHLPDVILLDIVMPDMSGYEVVNLLKKNNRTQSIPVIFISKLGDIGDEEKGLAVGATDYITKPFSATLVKLRVLNQIKLIERLRSTEKASKAKSTFLANMSHEIRTPMNAIWGITEILMQNEKLPKETKEGLGKIHNSCDLLLGIINDILDFSKVEAGKLDVMPAQYNVASLINDSIHLNKIKIGDKPIEFEVQIDENTPAKLIGDEYRIKQVLNNLLSNAFKYTDAGKVTLSVASKPSKEGIMLVLGVQDTGYGMTQEQVSKLFDEYSRFSVGSIEGTGLGLAITKRLVKLMEAAIHVESEPGKGSQFTVLLPQGMVDGDILGKELVENLRQFRSYYVGNEKKPKIIREPMSCGSVLIVDDVEMNLFVAEGLMKPYGLQIDTAMSGFETIDKVKSGKVYDVIFMDHMMPELDGIETTRQLRDLGYTAPIVALTANAVVGQADVFLQSGFDDFISKPIDVQRLNAVLNKLVRSKRPVGAISNNNKPQVNPQFMKPFARDIRKAVSILEELCQSRELGTDKELRRYTIAVHGMKSALANIGEKKLSAWAYKLETGGRERDLDLITISTPDFLNEMRILLEKIRPESEDDMEEYNSVYNRQEEEDPNKKMIFIVDDNDANLTIVASVLEEEYRVRIMPSAERMFSLLEKNQPDMILLDVEMPDMNGFEAMKKLKSGPHAQIPVIFITGLTDVANEIRGIELGAVDFITKPFSALVLINRIRNHLHIDNLIRKRTKELERLKNGIVYTLADLVENRDKNTGGHIDRTTVYMEILINAMLERGVYIEEMRDWDLESIISSARLHDVGKIVIPDSILNKPGPLTQDEFETMKMHAAAGERIVDKAIQRTGNADFLQNAKLFATYHHERWDGTGYSSGFKGTDIPLHGRIMAIIDVYDALVSERPYKKALSHEKAMSIILENSGKHFDPLIVDVFDQVNEQIMAAGAKM